MMKNLLFIFLLALSVFGATRKWDYGAGTTSWKTKENWADDFVPGPSDTALFDNTDTRNCTVDSAFTVGWLIIRSNYTGTFNDGGYACTTATACSVGTGGTFTASGHWVHSGTGIWTYGNSGTYNVTGQDLNFTNTNIIRFAKAGTYVDTLQCAASGKTSSFATMTGSATFYSGCKSFIANGGIVSTSASVFIGINATTETVPLTFSGTFTAASGAANGLVLWNGGTTTVSQTWPALTIGTGSNATLYLVRAAASTGAIDVTFTGAQNCNNMNWTNSNAASGSYTVSTGNYAVTAATGLTLGSTLANSTTRYDWGSSKLSFGSLIASNNATAKCTLNLESSIDTCKGDWTFGANWVVVPGTSTQIFKNTAKATLIGNGKSFGDLVINPGAGIVDSIADSSVYNSITWTTGKAKGLSAGGKCLGNMSFAGTDTMFSRLASGKFWEFPNAATFTQTTTGKLFTDSMRFKFDESFSFLPDSNFNCRNILMTAGKKGTIKAGVVVTVTQPASGGMSGTSAAPCSLISSSAGNATRLAFGVQKADSNLYLKDFYVRTNTLYDTNSVNVYNRGNGGNDSNVVFKAENGAYYLTPSVPTITSLSRTWSLPAGGEKDTITGTEFFPPCSVLVEGGSWIKATVIDSTKLWFVLPALAVGVKDVDVKNCDFQTVVSGNALTYVLAPDLTALKHPAGYIGYVDTIDGHDLKKAGGTATLNGSPLTISHDTHMVIFTTPTMARGTYWLVFRDSLAMADSVQFRVLVPGIGGTTP